MRALLNWLARRISSPSRRPQRSKLAAGRRPACSTAGFRPLLESLEPRELMARDMILDWNAVMLQANANDHARLAPEQGGPVLTGRAVAITSAAMYDAYNSIKHIGSAYLITAFANRGANADAAVAQAAHDTLLALFPSQKQMFDK